MTAHAESFRAPGDVYDRFVGRYSPLLAEKMCDAIGVRAGQRVLDVGCGSGALVAELGRRVGPENVTGVDPSQPFVEAARAKAPGARVFVGSAEELPFADDEFGATLSQLVVNFLGDPELGIREMARVTRPAGVVAGCVWDYAAGMTMLRTFWEAAVALDPERAAPRIESVTMRFATRTELDELWAAAGLRDVETGSIDVEASYDDFDDLWAPFPTGVGPAGAYAASLNAEEQVRLREEFHRRLGSPSGPFTLPARAWSVAGSVQ